MSKDIIKLQNIHIEFDDETIIEDLNLNIKDKEFVTLLGPSGCGKTTTLRTIAGFVTPDRGDIIFDGVKINNLPPHKRQVNTVFQKYALFTHLNVYDNIAFGLRINKTPKDEIDRKILETMIIKYQGKPIGIEALATTVGEDIDTLEDVYEPYLIQIGFISRTQRGRIPLPAAYKHIGAEYQIQF